MLLAAAGAGILAVSLVGGYSSSVAESYGELRPVVVLTRGLAPGQVISPKVAAAGFEIRQVPARFGHRRKRWVIRPGLLAWNRSGRCRRQLPDRARADGAGQRPAETQARSVTAGMRSRYRWQGRGLSGGGRLTFWSRPTTTGWRPDPGRGDGSPDLDRPGPVRAEAGQD